ncbi:MAG: hypothetical protein HY881_07855 [Deltaproteobacteria bacterium]|nr:hypothetical protein [Deltaproteobacteria bacterium]
MSSVFSMSVLHQGKKLYVQIRGGFDGSSARQLLSILIQYVDRVPSIVINTDGVDDVDVFGLNLLRYSLEIMGASANNLKFIGNHASVFQSAMNLKPYMTYCSIMDHDSDPSF